MYPRKSYLYINEDVATKMNNYEKIENLIKTNSETQDSYLL